MLDSAGETPELGSPGSTTDGDKVRTQSLGSRHKTMKEISRNKTFLDKAQKLTKREKQEYSRRMENLGAKRESIESVDQAELKVQEVNHPLRRKGK